MASLIGRLNQSLCSFTVGRPGPPTNCSSYTCGMYCITHMQKDGLATIVAIPSMAVAEMLVARPNQIARTVVT